MKIDNNDKKIPFLIFYREAVFTVTTNPEENM